MAPGLSFRDQGVLVAGSGGLGAECAMAFLEAGARVVVADINADRLGELEARAGEHGHGVKTVMADLADPAIARGAVRQAESMLGSVQVFVHAIGINAREPISEITDAQWNEVLAVNLSSAFWMGQAVGADMCSAGQGRIVFISSVSGLLAHEHHGPYAASKGGLNQLLRVMAREWASRGVGVNAVAPGYMETELTQSYLAKSGIREQLTSLVPAGRLGSAADVVGPVLFLASEMAAFVTGQVLYVDGGRVLV